MTERSEDPIRFHSCVGLGWFSFQNASHPSARCFCLSQTTLSPSTPEEPIQLNAPRWVHRLVAPPQSEADAAKEPNPPTVISLLPLDKAIKRYGCIGCMVYSSDLSLFRCLGYGMKVSAVYHDTYPTEDGKKRPQHKSAPQGDDLDSVPQADQSPEGRDYLRVDIGVSGTELDNETQAGRDEYFAPESVTEGSGHSPNEVPPPPLDWHQRTQLYSTVAKRVGHRSMDLLWINVTTVSSFVSSPIKSVGQIYERTCQLGSRMLQVVERCNRLVGAFSIYIKSPPDLPPT